MAAAEKARYWKIVNPHVTNAAGEPVAYKLVPQHAGAPLLAQPEAAITARATFATKHLWVTPFHAEERRAAGDFPNQHPGGDGLPKWTAADRPVADTDIVLWHTIGVTHFCRPGGLPRSCPASTRGSRLPFGFFDRNPGIDLAPSSSAPGDHCSAGLRATGTALDHAPPGTTRGSTMASVNGTLPTIVIIAGLALAGYALLMTALNRRMGVGLLTALGGLEILLLVEVGIVVARLADGKHPASVATLIGYLIAMPFVPVAAAFWGALERSSVGPGRHRRGRAGRGRADGAAARDLGGDPCLSPRHRRSPRPRRSAWRRRPTRPERVPAWLLVAVYGLFALSASARAGVQIATNFSATRRLPTCCRRSRAWSTSSPRSPSPTAARPHDGSPSRPARRTRYVLAVGTWSLVDRATFPTRRCGLATAAVTASSCSPARFRPALAAPLDQAGEGPGGGRDVSG